MFYIDVVLCFREDLSRQWDAPAFKIPKKKVVKAEPADLLGDILGNFVLPTLF